MLEKMKVLLHLGAILSVVLAASQDKAAVPPAAAQKDSEALIKSLFKEEYAKRTPEGQLALARKLLQQARETKDDVTVRYVLFRETADLASKAGEFTVALDAVKAMAELYDVDAIALKVKVLLDSPATIRSPDQAKAVCDLCLSVAGEAIELDRPEEAKGVLGKAETVAKATKDMAFVNRTLKQKKELEAIQVENQKAKAAEATLKTSPDDAAANLALGRVLLSKGKADQAIPRLAKGSDPALKSAAERDLADPKDSPGQVQAGNGWWDAAEKEAEGPFRKALQERARGWYESAYAASSGLSRVAIEKRLDALDRTGSAEPLGPPKLRLVTFAEFEPLAGQFRREDDLAAKFGKATASSHYPNRDPNNVFKGNRLSDAWTLNSSPGWFEAKWDPPVRGRTLLLVGRNSPVGLDQWGQAATLILNGSIKLPLKGMSGGKVIIVELGAARRLESLRAEITADGGYPGLGTVEVFR